MVDCPSEDILAAFAQGALPGADATPIEQHLSRCRACRQAVAETANFFFKEKASGAAEPEASLDPDVKELLASRRGFRLSRYLIGETIGAGGAGVVYRAYDLQLRRFVAFKLMWGVKVGEHMEDTAVLREAQAMARVSHPNVVNVFDAGTYDGRVFVVMELVDGPTLHTWLRERPRSQRDILDVFLDAGRGLAAAHAARLVHRDFKPENVLIGLDGRARVTDFGLAANPRVLSRGSSRPGGTPAYMSPEQSRGDAVDESTDQFSFCLAMQKALSGEFAALGDGHKIPSWLSSVLARGLDNDRSRRYPAMADLLRAIERGRARRRISKQLAYLAAATLAVAAIFLAGREPREGTPLASRVQVGPICGNGVVEIGEDCDDSNRADGDGCTSACLACAGGSRTFAIPGGGHCYTRQEGGATWAEALAACQQQGSYLFAIDTFKEGVTVLASLGLDRSAWYWAGFHDPSGEGQYEWDSGASTAGYGTRLGRVSLPKGGCAALRGVGESMTPDRDGAVHAMNDLFDKGVMSIFSCTDRRGFLCEKNPWITRTETGHAYRNLNSRGTWHVAQKACESMGANLATIDDAAEGNFLMGKALGEPWVGGIKAGPGEAFRWVAGGAPVPLAMFSEDDPNSRFVPACTYRASDGTLRDQACDGSEGGLRDGICEAAGKISRD